MNIGDFAGVFTSLATLIVWGFAALCFVVPFGYWFFIVRNRRVWHANIWELNSSGGYVLTKKDKVVEKKLKGKNAHVYSLRSCKYGVPPVQNKNVVNYKGKNFVDYLRIDSDYIPLSRSFVSKKGSSWELGFQPVPYDVMMQMISTDKFYDDMFKSKGDFLSKYGAIIGLLAVVVLMIVMMSMYYDFVTETVAGKVDEHIGALESLANAMRG